MGVTGPRRWRSVGSVSAWGVADGLSGPYHAIEIGGGRRAVARGMLYVATTPRPFPFLRVPDARVGALSRDTPVRKRVVPWSGPASGPVRTTRAPPGGRLRRATAAGHPAVMLPDTPTREALALATQLLADEAAALGSAAVPANRVGAADRLLGQLQGHLAGWIGRDGSSAVFARALDDARVAHPVLWRVHLRFAGEPHEPRIINLTEPIAERDAAEIPAAVVSLVAIVIALLTRLIGADLATRILQAVTDGRVDAIARPDATPSEPTDVPPAVPTASPDSGLAARAERPTLPSRPSRAPHEDSPQ